MFFIKDLNGDLMDFHKLFKLDYTENGCCRAIFDFNDVVEIKTNIDRKEFDLYSKAILRLMHISNLNEIDQSDPNYKKEIKKFFSPDPDDLFSQIESLLP